MAKKTPVIGVDVGGTKIAAGVVSPSGKILFSVRVSTQQHRSAARVRENIFEAIRLCAEECMPRAIGVGITGAVDPERGISFHSSNLPKSWKGVPLARILSRHFHVPVFIDNDANAIGLAEATWGKARRAQTALILTLGTGVGSVYIHRGGVVHGKTGAGAEFGHTIISERKVQCSCGKYGHFEALVSGPAMIRLYRLRTKKQKSTHDIVAEARRGKREARAVLEEMREYLGIGLANALHAFNPHIVVIGGGLANIPFLTRDLQGLVRPLLMDQKAFGGIRIVKSSIQHTAGILGGAALTMRGKSR
jgi:glucokinase